jgi:NAD(P)-dependent dehydrogenase (short-subunit alcohol dehydrogenase family)
MIGSLNTLFSLNDKVIIVTGATGLLGRKHAEIIAAYGGIPILLDLSIDTLNKLANELKKKYGVNAKGFSVDITNEEKVKQCSTMIIEKYGKINGLINNAANNPKVEDNTNISFSRLENFPLDIWNKDIAVGLTGAFLCSKYFGHKISQNQDGGVIINISSDLALIAPDQRLYSKLGLPENQQSVKPVTYSIVKTGLIGLTRYLSTYWADKNVRCNAICPGGVKNNQPSEFIKEVSSRIPLGRMADVNEYQGTILWMLSDASSYLNGAVIAVDGGRSAW